MLKNELIAKVSELESKLEFSEQKIHIILNTASNLLYGKDIDSYTYNTKRNNRLDNVNELFYEIWKLVEFRDNIKEQREYERREKSNERQIEFLENELNRLKNNQ